MAKILIPMNYYTSGYSGDSSYNITMSGEAAGYEARKAFTVDRNEYLKYKNDIVMGTIFASAGVQGVFMDSDEVFDSTLKNFHLKRNTTIQTPTNIWGHSNLEVSGDHIEAGGSISGRALMLAEFPSQTAYYDYRFSITSATDDRIQTLIHGVLIDLPQNYLETRDHTYSYPKSRTYNNLLGAVKFDGLDNPGIKRTHTAMFSDMNSTDKDLLITIFTLGKGGLQILMVPDTSNDSTWFVAGMKSLKITELFVESYSAELEMVEY